MMVKASGNLDPHIERWPELKILRTAMAHSRIYQIANSYDLNRFELFLLDEGQSKIEAKEETRVPNTALFTFNKEDHTLGNLLSQRLLKYDQIIFAAYKVPHPLFATFELRVQTDGTITPKEAVIRCCRDVVQDLQKLNDSFQQEWLGKRIVSEGEAERQQREQNYF